MAEPSIGVQTAQPVRGLPVRAVPGFQLAPAFAPAAHRASGSPGSTGSSPAAARPAEAGENSGRSSASAAVAARERCDVYSATRQDAPVAHTAAWLYRGRPDAHSPAHCNSNSDIHRAHRPAEHKGSVSDAAPVARPVLDRVDTLAAHDSDIAESDSDIAESDSNTAASGSDTAARNGRPDSAAPATADA